MFVITVILLFLAHLYASIWEWPLLPGLTLFPYRLFLPLAVIGYFLARDRTPLGRRPRIIRNFYIYLLFLVIYLGALIVLALDPATAFTNWVNIVAGLFVPFMFCETADSDRRLNQLVVVLTLILVGLLLVATWETTTGDHLFGSTLNPVSGHTGPFIYGIRGSMREDYVAMRYMPTATSWNPNDFGYRLCIMMLITLALFPVARSWLARAGIVFVELWGLYIMARTWSRASMIGVIVGGLVFMAVALRAGVRGRTMLAFIVLLAVGLGATSFLSTDESKVFTKSSSEPTQTASGVLGVIRAKVDDAIEPFTSGDWRENPRYNLTLNSLSYFLQSFGLGIGPGQVDVWNERHAGIVSTGSLTSPHNMWAEFIAEGGVPMCLPLFIFMALFLRRCFRGARRTNNPALAGHAAAAFALLIGFIPAAISPSGGITDISTWLVYGYAAAVVRRLAEAERDPIADGQAYEYDYQDADQAQATPGYRGDGV